MLDQRHEHRGIEEEECPVKIPGRNAQNGEGMAIELDHPADDSAIVLEMGVPVLIAQHDVGRAVGRALIGSMEKVAQIWLQSQPVEVSGAGFLDPRFRWIAL